VVVARNVGQGDAHRLRDVMQVHGIPAFLLGQIERGLEYSASQRIRVVWRRKCSGVDHGWAVPTGSGTTVEILRLNCSLRCYLPKSRAFPQDLADCAARVRKHSASSASPE